MHTTKASKELPEIWRRTSRFSDADPSARTKRIGDLLMIMGEMRGGSIGPATLRVYCSRLVSEPLEYVEQAIIALAESTRRDGHTAIPEMGRILGKIRALEAKGGPQRGWETAEGMDAASKQRRRLHGAAGVSR